MERIDVEKTASRGIAAAVAYKYLEPDWTPDMTLLAEEEVEAEQQRFAAVKGAVLQELGELAAENEIFAAHLEIADDFMLQEGITSKIRDEKKNAQLAVHEVVEEFAAVFAAMDDAYMKERGADIKDVGKRFLAGLKGIKRPDLGSLSSEVIVVAKDLYPSDTVKLSPELVKGIITEEGGVTSHVSIIAKSMNIPTLVGVKGILDKVEDGMMVCMDAEKGIIVTDPDASVLSEYQEKKKAYEEQRRHLESLRNVPAVTKDGKRISLCANVGNVEDIRKALPMNIDGVGLFRSEFLYMENTHFPTEEEQFEVYKEAAMLCPQELTIRTLDIGGDKDLSYFDFEKEENPFLGWRAIRISLDMKEMFKEQLRAILRASAFGHVRIMFPMIISLEELREAKALVEECKKELSAEGKVYDEKIELGMMMETPASVLLAETFAKEADFFSIGTNDLTQYLLAVDRGNKKIADRYDYFHPAVVSAIGQIIRAGHKEGIKVGMCGEMAGDKRAVPILLELGLDEFSMSAGSIDYVREQIINM
ncbi:phosphoenolpyruvate--protein phosphotransferase [Dorea acetigenes]|uniref:Phosphoenolpyruvate-protein phosphotransferase n=1 Tax=Dorea acetigenes TaxID=2981787 RepID=A0ABT2RRP8_9FIRM|nr:phosphoenolpyruvate--protein phosphotransferase [Dorea acetigenes]MCB6415822.1 phosphoenolpyruvate--protein phosphotransferase [Faecalimonas umbilicata]MCU6688077.1 phosphoenolpyruvate--protein phosphotransferase [Dorea acetigenes]SCJ65078.1 Phosphoenolpyruvate-protein phosphotransferase [uncultured Clostridium sp.]